jgi:hypothetical protein
VRLVVKFCGHNVGRPAVLSPLNTELLQMLTHRAHLLRQCIVKDWTVERSVLFSRTAVLVECNLEFHFSAFRTVRSLVGRYAGRTGSTAPDN